MWLSRGVPGDVVVDVLVDGAQGLAELGGCLWLVRGHEGAGPPQVVGHLTAGAGAASSPVIKARRLFVGDAGGCQQGGAEAPARAMTRGSPNRRAGVLRPSAVTDGCAIRSKAGVVRTVPWPPRFPGGPVIRSGAEQDRRAISVSLTPVTKGLSRSLKGSPSRWSGHIAVRIPQIPKLIMRVRFSSPAPNEKAQLRLSTGMSSSETSRGWPACRPPYGTL
jgi:hypothetical protein